MVIVQEGSLLAAFYTQQNNNDFKIYLRIS